MLTAQDLCNEEYSDLIEWIGTSDLNTYQIEDLLGIIGRLTQRPYCDKNDVADDNEFYNYSPVKLILTEILASAMEMLDENRNVKRFIYNYMENIANFKREVQTLNNHNNQTLTLVRHDVNQVRNRFTRLERICSLLANEVSNLSHSASYEADVPEASASFTPAIKLVPGPGMTRRSLKASATTQVIVKPTLVANKSTPIPTKSAPVATKTTPVAIKTTSVATKTTPIATKPTPVATKTTPIATKPTPVATKTTPIAKRSTPVAQKLTQVNNSPSKGNASGEMALSDRLRDLQNISLKVVGVNSMAMTQAKALSPQTTIKKITATTKTLSVIPKLSKGLTVTYPGGKSIGLGRNITLKKIPIKRPSNNPAEISPEPEQRKTLKVKPMSALIAPTTAISPTFNKRVKVVLKRMSEIEIMQHIMGVGAPQAKRPRLMQNDLIKLNKDEPVETAEEVRSRKSVRSSAKKNASKKTQHSLRSKSPTCLEALVSIAKANGYDSSMLSETKKRSLSYKDMHTGIFPIRTLEALEMYESFCTLSSHQKAAINYLISLRPKAHIWNDVLYAIAIKNIFDDKILASFKEFGNQMSKYKICDVLLNQWAPHSLENFSRLFQKEIEEACSRLEPSIIDPLSN